MNFNTFSSYKKFRGEIDQARFCNLICVFLFVVTHYESRLSNHLVLRY